MRDSPEFRLIERIRGALQAAGAGPADAVLGIGDDAAIAEAGNGVRVTSIDLCVEDVHFSDRFSDEQIGHKALATALSDLAAMGARPLEAYVGLIAPAGFDPDRAVAIASGIGSVAARCGVAVLGGDISAGAQLALSVTVVGGATDAGELVTRAGAQPGDVLLVSGELGGAAAGLVLLEGDAARAELGGDLAAALRDRQLEPWPRLALGAALAGTGARAMVDVSDGVVADAEQIGSESGVGVEIDAAALPVAAGVAAVANAAGKRPLELACAGEDYELLVAIEPAALAAAHEVANSVGEKLTEIGRLTKGEGVRLIGAGGDDPGPGFDHLRGG